MKVHNLSRLLDLRNERVDQAFNILLMLLIEVVLDDFSIRKNIVQRSHLLMRVIGLNRILVSLMALMPIIVSKSSNIDKSQKHAALIHILNHVLEKTRLPSFFNLVILNGNVV